MRIELDREELKSVVSEVVGELSDRFSDDDRLAYTESEAAELLGVKKTVLRDERLKGRIVPGKCGRNYLYSKKMLLDFVERNGADA